MKVYKKIDFPHHDKLDEITTPLQTPARFRITPKTQDPEAGTSGGPSGTSTNINIPTGTVTSEEPVPGASVTPRATEPEMVTNATKETTNLKVTHESGAIDPSVNNSTKM